VVIEEKSPTLERLVRDALYPTSLRPVVVGEQGPAGERVFPSHGLIDADAMLDGLRSRLGRRLADRLAPPPPRRERIPLASPRTSFFCPGAPTTGGPRCRTAPSSGWGPGTTA
jgi:indolepyruvate ferredoxin oxidoreductase